MVFGYQYLDWWTEESGVVVVKAEYTQVTCKYCDQSNSLVKFGTYKGTQQWWCKKCQRKFIDNNALPRMRTPPEQVGLALMTYFDGGSLSDVQRQLDQQFGNKPSDSSIYGWITRFSKVAIEKAKETKPNVGDTWVADETMLNIAGKNIWFWDIIDSKTRYLLASHMSAKRMVSDAQALMEKAARKAAKNPKVVITDRLSAYIDGIEMAFGSDTKHVQSQGFATQPNTNMIERFHGSIKERTKVMRGLQSIASARLFMDAWSVHYNHFRVHEAIHKTPGEKAGIVFPLKNWLDVAKQKEKPKDVSKTEAVSALHYGFEQARRHKPKRYGVRIRQKGRAGVVAPALGGILNG